MLAMRGLPGILFPIVPLLVLLALDGCSLVPGPPAAPTPTPLMSADIAATVIAQPATQAPAPTGATPTPRMSADIAATAIAELPTDAPAPPAPALPASGKLLVASTRLSPRPHSNLAMDFRLGLWSNGLQPVSLPGDQAGITDAAVTPDGRLVAAILGQTRVDRLDLSSGLAADILSPLGALSPTDTQSYVNVAWVSNQRLLLRRSGPGGLQTLNPDGSDIQLVGGTGQAPSVSPDGRRLALGFVRDEPFYSIHLTDLSFSEPRKLTDDRVTETSARWSPDGQWIAYAANVGFADTPPMAAWEIRIIRPDGTDKRIAVPRSPGISFPEIRWSPDGTQLAFTRYDNRAVTHQVSLMSLASGGEVRVSDGNSNDRVLAWLP